MHNEGVKIRPRWRSALPFDPWKRARAALVALAVILALGTSGYRLFGLDWFDALYQTAITVTTVGFAEIEPPGGVGTAYRLFTLGVVFVGVSGALYTLGVAAEAIVEGALNDGFRLRKEQRMIEKLSGHIVIAGAGRVGQSIALYARRHGADLVVIDHGHGLDLEPGVVVIEGDATDDTTLVRAGIERAATLVTALDSDAANVYVTLSARALNPNLYIVARTNSQESEPKFFQAGADRVVNPHQIGGSRMAAVALHPTVAEFLDEVLHDDSHDVHISEVAVASAHHGRQLGELLTSVTEPPVALALRGAEQAYTPLPPGGHVLAEGDVVVVLGTTAQIAEFRAAVGVS